MQTVLISPKETCRRTSLTRPTLDRLIAANEFPRPFHITQRRLAFDAAAVEEWMQSKLRAAVGQTEDAA